MPPPTPGLAIAAASVPLAKAPCASAATSPLAAPTLAASDIVEVLTAVAGLILLVLLAGILFAVIRKRTLDTDRKADETSLPLGGLRDLLKKGEITQEEFDAARNAVIAAHKPAAQPKPDQPQDQPRPKTAQPDPDKPNTGTTPNEPNRPSNPEAPEAPEAPEDPNDESDQPSNNNPSPR